MKTKMLVLAWCIFLVSLLTGCPINDPDTGESLGELAPTTEPEPVDTLAYRTSPTTRLLDVFEPTGTPSGVAVIFVHGGGWKSGDREVAKTRPLFRYLLAEGHYGFSIDYTLAREEGILIEPINCTDTESPFPENLEDVKWAIGWVNAHRSTYGIDRVIVVGESAGGHLAALASVTSDDEPSGLPSGYDIRPDGAITNAAPLNMVTWGAQPTETAFQTTYTNFNTFFSLPGNPNPLQCLYGSAYTTNHEVPSGDKDAADVIQHVDLTDPPIYMMSSPVDGLAPTEYNADELEDAYRALSVGGETNGRAWNDAVDGSNHLTVDAGANAIWISEFIHQVDIGTWDY